MADPGTPLIGWIGTGVMGAAMCGHVLRGGHRVVVHTRTRSKAQELLDAGARWVDDPQAVARECAVIITMVGFPEDVQEVYWGPRGILNGLSEGAIAVDMTTTRPSLAGELAKAAAARGARAVDAPVSGGDVGAREASLSIMVGGDRDSVQAVMPLLRLMGKKIVHQGPPGSGQHAKMCNQIVIAGTMIGVCESLLYAARAGLDAPTMLQSICGGAAACWSLDHLAPRILQRNFDPGFYVDHFIKDMDIAAEEARRMNLQLPGLELALRLYRKTQELGHGRSGTHALMLALEALA